MILWHFEARVILLVGFHVTNCLHKFRVLHNQSRLRELLKAYDKRMGKCVGFQRPHFWCISHIQYADDTEKVGPMEEQVPLRYLFNDQILTHGRDEKRYIQKYLESFFGNYTTRNRAGEDAGADEWNWKVEFGISVSFYCCCLGHKIYDCLSICLLMDMKGQKKQYLEYMTTTIIEQDNQLYTVRIILH
ncbi:hypothetical protein ACJX0J_014174 [Zea mays]